MRQSHQQASLSPLTVSKKYLPDQIQATVALHGHSKWMQGVKYSIGCLQATDAADFCEQK